MFNTFSREEVINYYLSSNFQGTISRNCCAKEITKFNKLNKQNKITIREIIAYALPSFDAYLTDEYPNTQFVNNFRCPLTSAEEENSSSYLWRYFEEYCQKFTPKFIFLGNLYIYAGHGCIVTHPISSFIKVETYEVFSLLRE